MQRLFLFVVIIVKNWLDDKNDDYHMTKWLWKLSTFKLQKFWDQK